MADFCSICCAFMFDDSKEAKDNVGSILMNYRALKGGDISIERIFMKYILPDLNKYIDNPDYCINVGGICEHCGLLRLSVRKEEHTLYLIPWCYDGDNPVKDYKIATIDKNELKYDEEVLRNYFNKQT